MSTAHYQTLLARVTTHGAEDIDAVLRPHDRRARKAGRDLFPLGVDRVPFTPEFRDPDTVAIGVRILEPKADLAELAVSLGTFALEKGAEIVVLNHVDYCGLERFGFRCERITGGSPEAREACERQVVAFWNLEVII